MKAFVTGGTGFVGTHLVSALRARGDAVTCLVRSPDRARALGWSDVRLVPGDLDSPEALRQGCDGADIVYHVAGRISARNLEEFLSVNRDGTARVLDAARATPPGRFVHVSSLAVGGPTVPGHPIDETRPPQPVTNYGSSKLAAETLVRASGIPWTIVRPPVVYGERDRETLRIFRLARAGWGPVMGDGTQELSVIYAGDLAEALIAASTAPATAGGVYYAAHPDVTTSTGLVQSVGGAVGRTPRIVRLPAMLARVALWTVGSLASLAGRATVLSADKADEFLAPRLDVPAGRPDAGQRLAGGDGSRDWAVPHGGLVPSGGLAVTVERANLTALDRWTLGYVVIATVALALSFRGDLIPHWQFLVAAHAMLVGLVLLAPAARHSGPVGRFLGDWYPMLLLAGLYGEIGVLTLDAGFQNDWAIQRLEAGVFGSQVSYRWIREMPVPWFSAMLHTCYLAYYAILYAAPAGLWFSGRKDAARHTILGVMITFYLCYVVFLFFPVAGPRYAFDLPHNAATLVWPARLAQWLLDRGDSWGAAFPSSHVAASVVATGFALRYWRPLGLMLLLPTAGLVLAVVYGQFHYGIDALTGLVLAGIMLAVMQRRRSAEATVTAPESVVGVLDASASS